MRIKYMLKRRKDVNAIEFYHDRRLINRIPLPDHINIFEWNEIIEWLLQENPNYKIYIGPLIKRQLSIDI